MGDDVPPTRDASSLTSLEVQKDLIAATGARQELGPAMDEHLIGAFLDRIEQRIDVRVDERLAAAKPPPSKSSSGENVGVVAASLALSIPIVAIAGGIAGGVGVAAVMAAVVALNLMYFIREAMEQRG
ncbi:MAG TPA: hypothetical protein VFB34_05625 [Chloroflexota bacterium]|nr:hypothetical protein [Chloroflexota bacterium]